MKPQHVEVHIDELVLHGYPHSDRHRLGAGVERELSSLFAEQGTPPSLAQGRELAHLNGGAFEVKPGFRAEAFGVQVAQAVYGGLTA